MFFNHFLTTKITNKPYKDDQEVRRAGIGPDMPHLMENRSPVHADTRIGFRAYPPLSGGDSA